MARLQMAGPVTGKISLSGFHYDTVAWMGTIETRYKADVDCL